LKSPDIKRSDAKERKQVRFDDDEEAEVESTPAQELSIVPEQPEEPEPIYNLEIDFGSTIRSSIDESVPGQEQQLVYLEEVSSEQA